MEVDPALLKELTDMGFGEARAARALHFGGEAGGVEGAVGWLTEHEADEGLDEPLLVPKVGSVFLFATDPGLRFDGVPARRFVTRSVESKRALFEFA